ncbi:MAG: hypothetical protein V3S55_06220 [Nitrospiraceae bacterium]
MTAADIARETGWGSYGGFAKWLFTPLIAPEQAAEASRFPAAVANHPAFTRSFNARLVAVGMAATMDKHRMMT